jgi:putative heme-binding domain-containing protein
VEWFQGKTLTGCANDLHGPYLGPDGWIYWCKGAFAKQTYTLSDGKEFNTRASHIFRARADGTGIEPVMTGGMDNPVGLAWSADGELFLSGTFFQHPAGGKRDGIIHVLHGGVYGKDHDVLDGHTRTGELLPMMTHLGPAAPVGMIRYGTWWAFGEEYEGNLFTCNFNLHKITRHVLKGDGATYKTTHSDFLVSDNTDFHPTDVLEDADGSLLIVDTGGWYKLCCPTSQLYKPDVPGAIYRVRRKGVKPMSDPRGLKIEWAKLTLGQLGELLPNDRAPVAQRAIHELALRGAAAIPALRQILRSSVEAQRRNAVWTLARINTREAREAINEMFARGGNSGMQADDSATRAALYVVGLWRDQETVDDRLGRMFATQIAFSDASGSRNLVTRRFAAEALGRSGAKISGTQMLLRNASYEPMDRSLEHAIAYALIQLDDVGQVRASLRSSSPQARRIALIALDQMSDGKLTAVEITPLLASTNALLRETAAWLVSRHPEWGDALASFFAEQLEAVSSATHASLQAQLEQFARNAAVQSLLVNTISSSNTTAQVLALRALGRSGVKELPAAWTSAVTQSLLSSDRVVVGAAVSLARSVPAKNNDEFNAALVATAERGDLPSAARMSAAAAVPGGIKNLSEPLYSRLLSTLLNGATVSERGDAASALARGRLSNARLSELAAHLKRVGPMELPKVLPAFARATNETLGLKLVESLRASKSAQALRAEVLKPAITNFPASVHANADALLASLNTDAAQQRKQIDEMLASLKGGDVRRGQGIFNSVKAACSSCHAIGYLGGNVGPDLTRVGQVRSERDLLEALVFPSASFVRSYEPVIVSTKSSDEVSGILKKDSADEIVLVTGPNAEQHIARSDVADIRPGMVSVMPSGLADQLSKEELADLLAFLKAAR